MVHINQTKSRIKKDQGFTLIELLVVIAIIGLLSSIVLASVASAKVKARDAERVSQIHSIRNALELYRNANGSYPANLTSIAPKYISAVPIDPLCGSGASCPASPPNPAVACRNSLTLGGVTTNGYCYAINALSPNATDYQLGAQMESNSGTWLAGASKFNSSSLSGGANWPGGFKPGLSSSANYIYDIKF
jgi:general secretion pathway protein G